MQMSVHLYWVTCNLQRVGKLQITFWLLGKYTQNFLEEKSQTHTPKTLNTGLVSSGVSLTSWGEGTSLALVGHPSSDGVTIKMPYGVDVLY